MNDLDQMTELSKQIGMTNAQRLAEANNYRSRVDAAKVGKQAIEITNKYEVPPDLSIKNFPKVQEVSGLVDVLGMNHLTTLIKDLTEVTRNIKLAVPNSQEIFGAVTTDITIPEVITVKDLPQVINGLGLLIQEIRSLSKQEAKQDIKVESPVVNIDTKALTKKMDDVLKAVKNIKFPEMSMPDMPDFPVFPVDKEGFPIVKVANMAVANNSSQNATPLDKYQPADQDETGATKYYGFLAPDRSWYIMSDTGTAQRYASGASGYSDAWTARATQTYLLLSEAF